MTINGVFSLSRICRSFDVFNAREDKDLRPPLSAHGHWEVSVLSRATLQSHGTSILKTHVISWNNTGLKWLYALVLASYFFKKNSIKKSFTALQKNKTPKNPQKPKQTNKKSRTQLLTTFYLEPTVYSYPDLEHVTQVAIIGWVKVGSVHAWNIRQYLKISNFKQTTHKALIL